MSVSSFGCKGLFVLCAAGFIASCATKPQDEKAATKEVLPSVLPSARVYRKTIHAMGTSFTCSVAVYNEDTSSIEKAVDAAFAEVARVEKMMSTHISESPVSQINQHAGKGPVAVPSELLRLIDEALNISKQTGGKFDISFGAVGRLWDFSKNPPTLPDQKTLETALTLVDYRSIVTDSDMNTVHLQKKGMSIGLGAIAKGYGVDRASAVLKARGIKDFILYGGGDIYLSGTKGGGPWRVGIQDPRNEDVYFADFDMPGDGAVVTSGDYEKFFVLDGKRYHHIIDPANGFPAKGVVSATIYADSAARADALATGIFVLGLEKGMKLIESDPTLEGILVDDALRPHLSSGLKGKATLRPIAGTEEALP